MHSGIRDTRYKIEGVYQAIESGATNLSGGHFQIPPDLANLLPRCRRIPPPENESDKLDTGVPRGVTGEVSPALAGKEKPPGPRSFHLLLRAAGPTP